MKMIIVLDTLNIFDVDFYEKASTNWRFDSDGLRKRGQEVTR